MDIESMRSNPAYAPVGIILGAFAWYAIKILIDHIPCIEAAQLRRTLLALMFSGMFLYMWGSGEDPLQFTLKENELKYEVSLLVAGGYYLANMFSRLPSVFIHHFLSVVGVISVILFKKGAVISLIFGFVVEGPIVIFALTHLMEKVGNIPIVIVLNLIAWFLWFLSMTDVYFTLKFIIPNQEVPIHLKIILALLSIFPVYAVGEYYVLWIISSLTGSTPSGGKPGKKASRKYIALKKGEPENEKKKGAAERKRRKRSRSAHQNAITNSPRVVWQKC